MNTEDNNDFYDDELSRSLISNDFEEDTPRRKKKSKKPLMICLIILLIAAVAGGTAWYMVQRHKPVDSHRRISHRYAEHGFYHHGEPSPESRSQCSG